MVADVDESFLLAVALRCRVALAVLLVGLPAAVHGQERPAAPAVGLFSEAGPELTGGAGASTDITVRGITTIRSRTVGIGFDRLAEIRATGGFADGPGETPALATLRLNLFDDAVLSAVVERTAGTAFGSGYVLSGSLDEVERGTWKLLIYDDDVITGTVRTPDAIYSIRRH